MALTSALISSTTADQYLAGKADWLALDSTVKDSHIYSGSNFFINNYTGITDDIINAPVDSLADNVNAGISHLAYSAYKQELYPEQSRGSVRKEKLKAGSVESDTEYSTTIKDYAPSLNIADDLFKPDHYRIGKGSTGYITR